MLSIVTINKNNRVGLQKTLNSLAQLRRSEFQWVFIDSQSTDGSIELAKTFCAASDILISEADSGIYNAMNKGITHATQPSILFLNSGDTLSSKITSFAGLDLDSQADLYLFGFQIRNQLRKPRRNFWRYWSMPTSHQAIVYSSALLKRHQFDESYRFAADFEHYLRINRQALKIVRNFMTLIINEPYGSDAHLPKLLLEYRLALLQNGAPVWWANLVYWAKTHYLKLALKA